MKKVNDLNGVLGSDIIILLLLKILYFDKVKLMCDINNEDNQLYSMFPAILKKRLINEELKFPEHTKYNYDKIKAYRCVRREITDNTPIGRDDFRSNIEELEKGIIKKRGQRINKDDICCYGTSLFQDRRILANKMYLPRPNKKICEGYVYKEGGPQLTDEDDSHINWWIYENADLTGFNFVQDLKR